MISHREALIALVTVPDRRTGRRLARAALKARLAACANMIPGLESHYWWGGKLEKSNEILILFKTARRHRKALERLILQEHPYDTPEFVLLDLAGANLRYLRWWFQSCQ